VTRVNILRRIKTSKGWANVALKRNTKKRIQWPSGGPFLIEWRENGTRRREAAGTTPAEALEAQNKEAPGTRGAFERSVSPRSRKRRGRGCPAA